MKTFKELMKIKIDEKKSATGYELYHKTFSGAMQHAYKHAKSKGVIVDPKEIDDKVATGPKKPSSGKTNRYSLKAGRKKVEIQVANLDNKRYELNMYIEGVELDEAMKWAVGGVYHQEYKNGDRTYFRADSVQKNKRWKGMQVDEFGGKQKKAKNATADEKVQGWETTPKNKIPKGLKEGVEIDEAIPKSTSYGLVKIGKRVNPRIPQHSPGQLIHVASKKVIEKMLKKLKKLGGDGYIMQGVNMKVGDKVKGVKEEVETRKGSPQIRFMWKRDEHVTESNKAKSLEALKTALAVAKFKKSGGKIQKQPPGIARGALKFRGKGGTTRDDDEETRINRGVMSWKKLRSGKKKK